jgi:hypothetical protein
VAKTHVPNVCGVCKATIERNGAMAICAGPVELTTTPTTRHWLLEDGEYKYNAYKKVGAEEARIKYLHRKKFPKILICLGCYEKIIEPLFCAGCEVKAYG